VRIFVQGVHLPKAQSYVPLWLTLFTAFIFSAFVDAQPNSQTTSSIKIPMHILIRSLGFLTLFDAHPVVKVQLGSNGHQEKLFFLVDTGCTSTMIDTKTAKRLCLIVGAESYTGIGAYSQFITHKAELPWLSLGPIEEHHLPVQIMDLSNANFVGDIDGILGVDFWKKYLLTLDYGRNEIELRWSGEPKHKKQIWIIPTFNDEGGRLYVNTTIDNLHHVPMLIDTCSPTTTMPYELAKEIFADEIEKSKFRNYEWDVNGGKAKVAAVHTKSFQMGDFACTGLIIHVFKNDGQGSNVCIIGSDFLRNYRAGFDFPNQRLILEK
jgi:predicted aspartyl protease